MSQSKWMKVLTEHADRQHARNLEEAANHRPACNEASRPVIRLDPEDISPGRFPADGHISLLSPRADGGEPQMVGFLSLGEREGGALLWLGKISVQSRFERQGYGSAALRSLVERARSAGYVAIAGEIAPEPGVTLHGLREFYRRLGFKLDHGGRDRLWLQLREP